MKKKDVIGKGHTTVFTITLPMTEGRNHKKMQITISPNYWPMTRVETARQHFILCIKFNPNYWLLIWNIFLQW